MPNLPGVLEWRKEGVKVLEVFGELRGSEGESAGSVVLMEMVAPTAVL